MTEHKQYDDIMRDIKGLGDIGNMSHGTIELCIYSLAKYFLTRREIARNKYERFAYRGVSAINKFYARYSRQLTCARCTTQ